MKKISIVGTEAREKGLAGISYVGSAVTSTIGPYGLNFVLEKQRKSTNDGYLIASELVNTIEDEFERIISQMAHEASSKTNDKVGDGTSTAWALTTAICKEASRFLPNDKMIKAKKSPSEIAKMIMESKDNVLGKLSVTPITNAEELIKSALVSVEDEKLATMLGEMQWELGPEGVVVAEEVNESESSIEKVTGIRLDNGFGGSHLVTDPEKGTLEVKEVPIILTNYTVGVEELKIMQDAILQHLIMQKKGGVVLVARAFTADAIKKCQEAATAGFAIFPINAPYTDQREVMKDIEAVVGGRYIDSEESSLSDIYITDVGYAKRLVARISDAIVTGIDDENSKTRISERAEDLKKKLKGAQSDFEKKLLESRIAQLTNGFALLKVGSSSVIDRKRLKDKCDDATQAVRHALKGGTVKGGGLAFKEIADTLDDSDILKRPLTVIHDQIVNSAPEGFEIADWVRDPYLVVKCALEQACASSVGIFTSINGIITTKDPHECTCFNKQSNQ